jgi:26S proteasome regulatory subunit N5
MDLEATVSRLLQFEKKCRLAGDFFSLRAICVHLVVLCRNKEDWEKLNAVLVTINKRRNQSKTAITGIVEAGMGFIDSVVWPSQAVKVQFLETLKEVCAGKMYVEAESARLHLALALLHEADGDIGSACDMIQDVHVETFGSLSKKEKAEYILEQIRLNLARKDFIRSLIQSRKMNRKTLEEAGFIEIKVKFYRMMVEYYTQERDSFEIAQSYFKLYEAAKALQAVDDELDALQSCVVHLLLSKHDNHQKDMVHRVNLIVGAHNNPAAVAALADYSAALTLFTTQEIIAPSFGEHSTLLSHASIGRGPNGGSAVVENFRVQFRSRVNEHNLRVVSTYYTRIRLQRLCVLTSLGQEELEQVLSDMFTSGELVVKIDRPAGVVDFSKPRGTETILSDWSADLGQVLHLMEATCHLINRENMIYKV